MNNQPITDSDSTIEMIFAKEQLRQAHHSFNLAFVTTAACVFISFAGVGLYFWAKLMRELSRQLSGLLASTAYCLKLSKDANDRLDKVAEEFNDDR
jgi:hypothetical protein